MRLSSWFRWTAILGVLAVVGASDSHAFQNLDFESTGYPVDSNGVFVDPSTCSFSSNCSDHAFNPTVVMPGWTLSTELFDGSPVPEPYTLHGVLILGGHIGGTTDFHLTDAYAEEEVLEGKHSLSFRAGSSVDFSQIDPENYNGPLPGDGYAYPVASQEGIIPPGTQSVTVLVSDIDSSYFSYLPADGSGFTVRFDGYEVAMRLVDITDFPDVTSEVHLGYQERPYGRFFAGNIEPLGFSRRMMSIRPEKGNSDPVDYYDDLPSMLLDAISFSAYPAPGPPIQLPEPSTAGLAIILLFAAGSGRGRIV